MSKIIDRTGKGSSISQAEFDANYDSLHGINQGIAGATHTVDISDQGDTLEFTSGGAVAVTLDDIATILAAAHTSDFKVTLISIGTGTVVTITPDGTDSINTAASTIVLSENQYVTIQTDSTNAIWNIIESSNARNLDGIAATSFLRSDANDSASGDIGFSGAIDFTGGLSIGSVAVSATATELNILDGATVSTAELNDLAGNAVDAADFTKLSQVTSTSVELNILDGVTSTTAELNILDGVTASTVEINQLDGATIISKGTTEPETVSSFTATTSTTSKGSQPFSTLAVGDMIACNVHMSGTKGGTGGIVRFGFTTDAGTGDCRTAGSKTDMFQTSYIPASTAFDITFSCFLTVINPGTITVTLYATSAGSDSTGCVISFAGTRLLTTY